MTPRSLVALMAHQTGPASDILAALLAKDAYALPNSLDPLFAAGLFHLPGDVGKLRCPNCTTVSKKVCKDF